MEPTVDNAGEPKVPDLADLEKRDRGRPAGAVVDLEAIRDRALVAAKAAVDVKGEDVKLLDMHEVVTYTDFMVVCTGRNARLTRRIAQEVAYKVKEASGVFPVNPVGGGSDEWILLDFLDFVVHVFTPEAREFYRLDVLWKQAPVEDVV